MVAVGDGQAGVHLDDRRRHHSRARFRLLRRPQTRGAGPRVLKLSDMKLTREASAILGGTTIGMLALRSGRLPLVNPAVFSFAQGSLWVTTSRYAAKTIIARKDPRAAFLVDGGRRAVLL